MKKYRLVGSAPTLERMRLLLCNYFYSDCKIVNGEVFNSTNKIEGYRIIEKKGRVRFEMELPQ